MWEVKRVLLWLAPVLAYRARICSSKQPIIFITHLKGRYAAGIIPVCDYPKMRWPDSCFKTEIMENIGKKSVRLFTHWWQFCETHNFLWKNWQRYELDDKLWRKHDTYLTQLAELIRRKSCCCCQRYACIYRVCQSDGCCLPSLSGRFLA